MFKSFQDTSNQSQFKSFPNLNMQQANSAYGFSGATFWLDAAYGLSTQTNLANVSRWQARVGNSIFEQATAGSQPRLVLNDTNYNNYPSVQATATRLMATVAGTGLRITPQMTIAVISKVDTNINVNYIIGRQGGIAQGNGLFDGGNNAGFNGFGFTTSDSSGNIIMQGTTENLSARIKIITNTNIIVNGSVETTGTCFQNVELLSLFSSFTFANLGIIGSIAEIIAFPYSMTSIDAITLSNNINQKYAIY